MATEKPTPTPAPDVAPAATLDPIATPKATPTPAMTAEPAFEADAFLAGRKSEPKKAEAAKKPDVPKTAPPQIVKRGGVGFFTAFLMSTVAAGAGAYLALLAGSRPDLLQKAGIAAFVPQAAKVPSLGVDAGNIAPLTARISAVEAELLALKTRLDGGAPVPSTPPTSSTQQATVAPTPNAPAAITGAAPSIPPAAIVPPANDSAALKSELQGISGRVTAIETRLAALDPTGAGGAIVAGLQADIAGLKAIIATLQQQAAAAPSPAVTFAVLNLTEATNRPGPFSVELDAVRAAMPNTPEVTALEGFARTGVPTRELLQQRFGELAPALTAAQTATIKDTSMVAWFKGLFSNMVKVQSAPDANGTGNGAILSRAKTKLEQGDFAGSVDEVATIATPPAVVAQWVSAGRNRLELESRVRAVRGAIGRAPATAPTLTAPAFGAPAAAPLPPPPVPVTQTPATPSQGKNP